ncbi:alpha/beta family hydrolase [Aliivibrio finisterrensis]|uniref:Alpha/beta hydrolase n=1 Tax=Aliivibrio finisterrensis TaxID=511998 RepID=A0A6N6RXM1_9GAMM|nr:alpha/beta family hydrolase [Aliivibrio finisterrensis]KAB2826181.1 alpha/beta hydrolase [Aliivibrio finisterrensis]
MKLIFDGPKDGPLFVFSHGAGAPLDSDFMQQVAQGLAKRGIQVVRFNYHYMQQRIETGSRRPPERAPKLLEQFTQVLSLLDKPMIIGGKSMGGRMASLLLAEQESELINVKGLACLGYPFHPQGKPEKLRTEHLPDIAVPILMLQGDRDALGNKQEVQSYNLPDSIQWLWLPDGDHDLKPRIKSGYRHQDHIESAIERLATFIFDTI